MYSEVKKLLEQILETELGQPWKLNNKAVSAVIPILKKPPYPERKYILIQETDQANITDTGSIDKAKIQNKTDKNVFVRKGTLLEGDTQERGVVVGTVIKPQTEQTVKIQCVHASKGIRAGAKFKASDHIAPRAIMSSFMSGGSQSRTWRAAEKSSKCLMAMADVGVPSGYGHMADDIVGNLHRTTEFKKDIEDALKQIPADQDDQVGIIIIDMNGVVGLEVFDHPESWRAFSKSITRNYADIITQESEKQLFNINMDQVSPVAEAFIKNLVKLTPIQVTEGTYKIEDNIVVGEFTELDSTVIHLIAARKEAEDDFGSRRLRTNIFARATDFPQPQSFHTVRGEPAVLSCDSIDMPPSEIQRFVEKKEAVSVLETLRKKPQTYTELKTQVDLSDRTLSDRLHDGVELGLLTRQPFTNGKKRYVITEKGVDVVDAV